MNERIRALAEQAEQHARDDLIERRAVGAPLYAEGEYDSIIKQKFAELLVKECIAQCEQVATAADAKSKSKFVTDDGRMLHEGMWGGAKNCSGQIKQHFGVAE
jgi:hypothetical protein